VLWQSYPDGDSAGSPANPIAYDAAGRLKAVPGLVSSILYDARGRQTNVIRANAASTLYGYSAQRGWLTALTTTSTAGTIQDLSYGRDAAGRITGVTSPIAGESWLYGYDDLDRLTSADNTTNNLLDQTFQYDSVGNMLSNSAVGSYSYPAAGFPRPHAVTATPLGSYQYDANGSMTNQGADLLAYDGENRLATHGTMQFVYGPDGARLKKIDGAATTLYLGDDVEIAGGVTTKYLPGDAKRVGLATTTWLHRDHLRSVRAITNSSGGIVDRANYRPFGEQLGFAGGTESKGYIGERLDDETGLMYLHARYYDPVLARFIQADPMSPALPGVGVNRYAYALNNPVMFADPLGLNNGEGGQHHNDPGSHGIGGADPDSGGCTCDGADTGYAHEIRAQSPHFTDSQMNGILSNLSYLNQNDIFLDFTNNTVTVGNSVGTFPGNMTVGGILAGVDALLNSPALHPQYASTEGSGVTGTGVVPNGGVTFDILFVTDDKGNVGIAVTVGVGPAAGIDASVAATYQRSNAPEIYDLRGPFTTVSGGIGALAHVGAVVYTGYDRQGNPVIGGGPTFGPGAGAGVVVAGTATGVVGVNIKDIRDAIDSFGDAVSGILGN